MKFLLPFFLLLLTACQPFWQTKPETTRDQRWQNHQQSVQAIENWSFQGRSLIRQGQEGWNAGLRWTQNADDFRIKLSGPFAQGGMLLAGDDEAVTLTLDDGESHTAATPEALLEETVGWLLPVSALRDWVRGLPHDGLKTDFIELNEDGQMTRLEQAGWQVEIKRYKPFAGTRMPDKVFIEHPDLSLRLVMNRWREL